MRITGQDNVNTITKSQTDGVFNNPNPAASNSRVAQNSGTPTDQIELGTGQDLVSLAQNVSDSGRSARLEQIRQQVQSGTYQVDSAALSQSLVSAALSGN